MTSSFIRLSAARLILAALGLVCLGGWSDLALANWTLNVGYQNPAVSTWGLNVLYMGSQWGFEAGIGWIDVATTKKSDEEPTSNDAEEKQDDDDDEITGTRVNLAGDLDVKYFFSSGKLRPYIQGGFGVGIGAGAGKDAGAGAGTGGGFAGLGLIAGTPSLYVYGSYNLNANKDGFAQAGIGFDI